MRLRPPASSRSRGTQNIQTPSRSGSRSVHAAPTSGARSRGTNQPNPPGLRLATHAAPTSGARSHPEVRRTSRRLPRLRSAPGYSCGSDLRRSIQRFAEHPDAFRASGLRLATHAAPTSGARSRGTQNIQTPRRFPRSGSPALLMRLLTVPRSGCGEPGSGRLRRRVLRRAPRPGRARAWARRAGAR